MEMEMENVLSLDKAKVICYQQLAMRYPEVEM